jgi:hypothetical protein
MAIVYLRSTDGSDSDDGSTWALAKATLAAALTAAGAGGTVYVSQSHAETQASAMTLASPGTAVSITKVICVNDGAAPPTSLATTATVSTTGANNMSFTGHAYVYGITFTAGNSTNAADMNILSTSSAGYLCFDTCILTLGGNNLSSDFILGTATTNSQKIDFANTTLNYSNSGNRTVVRCEVSGKNVTIGGTAPTTLFIHASNSAPKTIKFIASDLSLLGSSKYLVNPTAGNGIFAFSNCKLGASVAVLNGSITGQGGTDVFLDNCDSGDTNYRMEHYKYQGSIKSETSKIRSGGASDGTTPISWNMTSLSGATFASPLESPPITIWNETTGSSKTVTIEIAQDSAATALNDDEIWIEVEYLGTSGYPISSIATDRKNNILSSVTAQTTSSATWDNMTTPTKQKLEVTFTPQEKGPFIARVMLAKASTTVYIDPLVTVS